MVSWDVEVGFSNLIFDLLINPLNGYIFICCFAAAAAAATTAAMEEAKEQKGKK